MNDKVWTLNNHLTEEQRPRVAEWLHMLGIEQASFTAVQDPSEVRIEFRRSTSPAPDAALSVLRDLVDLFDNVGIGVRGRKERFDHAWERARRLVAEHPPNEETP